MSHDFQIILQYFYQTEDGFQSMGFLIVNEHNSVWLFETNSINGFRIYFDIFIFITATTTKCNGFSVLLGERT